MSSLPTSSLAPLLAGVGFAGIGGFWLSGAHLDGAVTASDFQDYCLAVLSLQGDEPAWWPPRRSRLAALPAAPWESVGDSLRRAAWLGSVGTGAGLYVWGREIAGRWGGACVVVAALALAPLTVLPRMLSFYPVITAILVAASAATAAGLRRGGPALVLGAVGVAACLLVDVRGAFWAATLGALLVGAGVGRRQPGWLACAALVVALSFPLGRWAYPPQAEPLESQVNVRELVLQHDGPDLGAEVSARTSGFVWGRSTPAEWPQTAAFLVRQWTASGAVPINPQLQPPRARRSVVTQVLVGGALTLLAVPAVWRRRGRSAALALASLAPGWLALVASLQALDLQVRFLTHAAPALAVGAGALVACLIAPARPALAALAVAVLALCVGGLLPSPLGPSAAWRVDWPARTARLDQILYLQRTGRAHPTERALTRCAWRAEDLSGALRWP